MKLVALDSRDSRITLYPRASPKTFLMSNSLRDALDAVGLAEGAMPASPPLLCYSCAPWFSWLFTSKTLLAFSTFSEVISLSILLKSFKISVTREF